MSDPVAAILADVPPPESMTEEQAWMYIRLAYAAGNEAGFEDRREEESA